MSSDCVDGRGDLSFGKFILVAEKQPVFRKEKDSGVTVVCIMQLSSKVGHVHLMEFDFLRPGSPSVGLHVAQQAAERKNPSRCDVERCITS